MRNEKLSKAERHTAYIIMQRELEVKSPYGPYLCHLSSNVLAIYLSMGNPAVFENTFPELWDKKPHYAPYAWFGISQWRARINLLQKCIEETANY